MVKDFPMVKNIGPFLEKICRETGCSMEIAMQAYNYCSCNLDQSIQKAKELSSATAVLPTSADTELPKVIKYRNGLMVRGTFYCYDDPRNRELLDMLERNEFDRELLGISGDTADILVEDRNEYYTTDVLNFRDIKDEIEMHQKRIKKVAASAIPSILPSKIIIDELGTVKFQIQVDNSISTVLIDEKKTIGDAISDIYSYTGHKLKFKMKNEVLDDSQSVVKIKQTLVEGYETYI